MNVFNPKILDASIRDVSSCLSDNQKVELLIYAIKSLHFEGCVLCLLISQPSDILLFPRDFLISTVDPQTL